MELYSNNQTYKLFHGNMLDLGEVIEDCSIDSVVTDPPYELNFMGKGWDNSGIAFQKETREKCLKALKPGGYLLAFGGSRTFHRIACAIEDAGFEIRDCIMWLYGSGFPKSMNIGLAIDKKNGVESKVIGKSKSGSTSKAFNLNEQQREAGTGILAGEYDLREAQNEWNGWGTALKPSYEPIIVARKPLEGSCTDNVIKYGVGGINIDECRVGTGNGKEKPEYKPNMKNNVYGNGLGGGDWENVNGRFPANTILTYGDEDKDEVISGFPDTKGAGGSVPKVKITGYGQGIGNGTYDYVGGERIKFDSGTGSAARYFYCAKASKRDRDEGLDGFEAKTKVFNGQSDKSSEDMKDVEKRFTTVGRNSHPTVKPTSLMQYLVRLVTPNGGTVLDPFNGSGSTGKAVMYENKDRNKNYKYIGIELTEEYLPIAKARIEYVRNKGVELEKEVKQEQPTEQRKETALFKV